MNDQFLIYSTVSPFVFSLSFFGISPLNHGDLSLTTFFFYIWRHMIVFMLIHANIHNYQAFNTCRFPRFEGLMITEILRILIYFSSYNPRKFNRGENRLCRICLIIFKMLHWTIRISHQNSNFLMLRYGLLTTLEETPFS